VKFSCDRCGKKYATADNPQPGRVYKLKCKACGHLIVVKPLPATSAGPAVTPAPTGAAPPPEVELVIGQPEPTPVEVPRAAPPMSLVPIAADPTAEVSSSSLRSVPAEEEFRPPPGDTGYVDLFAEPGKPESAPPPPPSADPFLHAARASLPESFSGGASADPFAPIRAELQAAAGEEPAPEISHPLPTPKVPEIPKPPEQKQGASLVLIGVGVALLLAILGFVVFRSKKIEAPPTAAIAASPEFNPTPMTLSKPEPAPPAPAPAAAAPEPPPAAEPPPPPEPKREAKAEPPRREEPKAADKHKKPEKKPEPPKVAKAEPPRPAAPPPKPAPAPARSAGDGEPVQVEVASADSAPQTLTDDQIQKVLANARKAFDGCIANAGKSDVKLDGRKVTLRLNVQENGSVTYPTLDDVTLSATDLGACLKTSARLMVFPRFKGDPIHVEVPLSLTAK